MKGRQASSGRAPQKALADAAREQARDGGAAGQVQAVESSGCEHGRSLQRQRVRAAWQRHVQGNRGGRWKNRQLSGDAMPDGTAKGRPEMAGQDSARREEGSTADRL